MRINEFITEKWSKKYKSSINCSHPRGFSQRAHCAGKRKNNESVDASVMEMVCEDCGMCETHSNHENLDEACWAGYHKEGNKKMFGKTYPNCVKNKNKSESVEQGVAEGSLNEFAPGGDDEDGDEDPYRYPKPTRYRRSADYFNQFEADHFDREDFDDATGVFKGYQDGKHIAHFKFDDPAQTGGDDSGQGWYYEPKYNNSSGNNTAAPAVDRSAQRKQQELDMIDAFLKSGNRPNADSQIGQLMKKHGVAEGARVARKAGQPADSKKHSDLYTDENPRGTITGLKFATAEDARASVSKIRNSGRSHAHKIQAAVAMEQRARAAGKTEAAAVYRRYINATKKTESAEAELAEITEDLRKWFKDKWVRFGPDGKIRGDCARGSAKEGKPKCLPQSKAHALGKKGRASAAARKRRQDPNANRSGKAINVKTK